MARPIYSASFLQLHNAAAGDYFGVTMGTGEVGVIRSMDFVAPSGWIVALEGFSVDLYFDTSPTAGVWWMGPGKTRQGNSYHWRGRATFTAEELPVVHLYEDGWSCNISGYHLLS